MYFGLIYFLLKFTFRVLYYLDFSFQTECALSVKGTKLFFFS